MSGATEPGFDAYAEHYGDEVSRGTSLSGESSEFFARGRVVLLARSLAREAVRPERVLDYGCGTGTAAPFLADLLGAETVVGVDVSEKSIAVARLRGSRTKWFVSKDLRPAGDFDVVYCSGVFHHIPPSERPEALAYVLGCLRPGGIFALWENNPWNPGTQLVMHRIAFDRDAVKVSAAEARRIVRRAGFEVLSTRFAFIFPRKLGALRFAEPWVSALPLGAQYQVLARKPQ